MMPPPPPAVMFRRTVQKEEAPDELLLQDVESHLDRSVQSAIRREKLLMISQDLRASIALTEMKQERFRLMDEASKTRQKDSPAHYKTLLNEIFSILDILEALSMPPPKKDSDPAQPTIASLGGSRFHCPDCVVVERIPKEKRMSFSTEKEAVEAGYSPCSVCFPSSSSLVGSRDHAKIHRDSCIAVKHINNENLLSFSNEKEAFDLGFSPCKLCMHE
ncbi:hypothetical protein D6764_01800 [Candidatus Woesearchaeota archaeon]|nr:MAG: hypothetical protein D6764_01800 [Candidatus Woesearchaeota archaeon]